MKATITAQAGVPLDDKTGVNKGYLELKKYLKSSLTFMIQNKLIAKQEFTLKEYPELIVDKIWIEVDVEVSTEFLGSVQQYCAAKRLTFKFKL